MNRCNTNTFFVAMFVVIGHFGVNGQPRGSVETFTYNESAIFPGTTREVSVYIPAQLEKGEAACVYVQHDGLKRSEKFPRLLDSLIDGKHMPVTVGIFVAPGRTVPSDEKNRPRPNRSLEYDGLGDDQARFLLEELLPEVARRYNLKLSDKGNDRAIGGMSSGGIAAFNAAWERPDAFSRVYCNSGSFVAFRGGDMFPSLVRKTEPKPIRFFLTAGTKDMENAAGEWTLSNHQMVSALKFAAYDFRFKLLDGGHVVGYEETFAEAMAFLWRDWPDKISPGAGAPRVRDIILPETTWKKIAAQPAGAGKPVCNSRGEVFFPQGNKVMKIGDDNTMVETGLNIRRMVKALAVGRQNELYVLDKRGRITVYDTTGRSSLFSRGVRGDEMIASPTGLLYVADHATGRIYLVQQDRKPVTLAPEFTGPSALALAPDNWQLAIGEKDDHRVYNFTISSEGTPVNGERFFWFHRPDEGLNTGVSDLVYDREGHLVAATSLGVQFCGDDGRTVAILSPPGSQIAHISFGGKDLSTLYAFCKNGIYVRKLKVHGTGAFTPWMRIRKTPL